MPSVRALIMKKRSYGEGDLLIDILGSHGEKYRLLAKNARQSKKRFVGGVLDPLQFAELSILERSKGFDLVTEGKIIYPFQSLRESYAKLTLGFYFTKIIDQVTMEGIDENKSLFDLLGNSLRTLEKSEDIDQLKVRFQLKLLFYMGLYSPIKELNALTSQPVSAQIKEKMSDKLIYSAQNFVRKTMVSLDLPFS